MKSLFPALIISSLFVCNTAISQITGNIAPEVGIWVFSGPHEYESAAAFNLTKSTRSSLPILLAGIHGNVFWGKHFHLATGLQYQALGSRYESRDEIINYSGNTLYTIYEEINQTYQKLCMPVELGYQFRIWSIYPSFHIGYRFNYFVTGNYYSKEVIDYRTNQYDYLKEIRLNPFDKNKMEMPANRYNGQFSIGISALFFKRLQLDLSTYSGRALVFAETKPSGWCCYDCFNVFYYTDNILSARYYLLH